MLGAEVDDARTDAAERLAARRRERRVAAPALPLFGPDLAQAPLVPFAVVDLDETFVRVDRERVRTGDRRGGVAARVATGSRSRA